MRQVWPESARPAWPVRPVLRQPVLQERQEPPPLQAQWPASIRWEE